MSKKALNKLKIAIKFPLPLKCKNILYYLSG